MDWCNVVQCIRIPETLSSRKQFFICPYPLSYFLKLPFTAPRLLSNPTQRILDLFVSPAFLSLLNNRFFILPHVLAVSPLESYPPAAPYEV